MRVIDAHLQLLNPGTLTYRWLDGDLNAALAEAEISQDRIEDVEEQVAVFVQADTIDRQAIDEVRWVDSIAQAAGVVAIVAGARLDRKRKLKKRLDALAQFKRVVGVRHLLHDEKDGFARRPAFIDGARAVAARGLTFDACVRSHQLSDIAALARAVPELRIVLNHLGKPAIGTLAAPIVPSPEWIRDLRELAANPRVHVKLSGLPAEAEGAIDEDQMEPFLDIAADVFGEDRLIWGSDWPMSSVDTSGSNAPYYFEGNRDDWCHTVSDWASGRGLDTEKLFWSNALSFYNIR